MEIAAVRRIPAQIQCNGGNETHLNTEKKCSESGRGLFFIRGKFHGKLQEMVQKCSKTPLDTEIKSFESENNVTIVGGSRNFTVSIKQLMHLSFRKCCRIMGTRENIASPSCAEIQCTFCFFEDFKFSFFSEKFLIFF